MSEYEAGFQKGELARKIALRGMSQQEFATHAGITTNTLLRAIRGGSLRSQTWGKIEIALSTYPEKVAV